MKAVNIEDLNKLMKGIAGTEAKHLMDASEAKDEKQG